MLDGKAVNAITDTNSSQTCNVCKAKPSEMNNLSLVRLKPLDPKAVSLGISSLHCWMRSFEFLLHLEYKLPIGKYYARTPEEKVLVESTKKEIKKKVQRGVKPCCGYPQAGLWQH